MINRSGNKTQKESGTALRRRQVEGFKKHDEDVLRDLYERYDVDANDLKFRRAVKRKLTKKEIADVWIHVFSRIVYTTGRGPQAEFYADYAVLVYRKRFDKTFKERE